MYKVLAIGGADVSLGFALAGLETCRAESPAEAAEALARARDSGEYGIVVIDEELAAGFDEKTNRALSGGNVPVVVAVPGQMRWRDIEAVPRDDYTANLIRQAIGYQLDIQL